MVFANPDQIAVGCDLSDWYDVPVWFILKGRVWSVIVLSFRGLMCDHSLVGDEVPKDTELPTQREVFIIYITYDDHTMAVKRTDIYYARAKLAILIPVVTFASLFLMIIITAILESPEAQATAELSLLEYSIIYIFMLSIPTSILLLWHSIYKDKQELSKYFLDVERRHWIFIGILGILTSGVYILWYLYSRYKLTKNQTIYKSSVIEAILSIIPLLNIGIKSRRQKETDKNITKIKSQLNDAFQLIEEKNINSAEESLGAIEEEIDAQIDITNEYELNDLNEDLTQLDQRREDLVDKISEVEREQRRESLQEEIDAIRSETDEIEALVKPESVSEAQMKTEEIESDIESVKAEVSQHNSNEFEDIQDEIEELEQEREKLLKHISEVQKQKHRQSLTNEIDTVNSEIAAIEELIEKKSLDEAQSRAEELEPKIESLISDVAQYNYGEFREIQDEIEELEQKRDSLLSNIAEAQRKKRRQSLTSEIDTVNSEIAAIEELIEKESLDEAQSRAEELESNIESIEESIQQYNSEKFENIRKDLTQIKKQREDILDQVSEIRREQRHRDIENDLDALRSEFDNIDALVEEDSLDEAQTKLEEISSKIDQTETNASQYGFDSLQNDVKTLEKQRQTMLERVAELIESNAPPDTIPQTPNVSVDYNELTDEEPIGSGGNADVKKATLCTPDGDVTLAIKQPRMAGTLHTDAIERMLGEAETWDKLDDHKHIVGVIDYGSNSIPWIAMEYMDAGHLGDRSGELDLRQALWTSITVTKGVRHAHRRGVAHLDLKPENVLFCSVENGWDVPKVADWGLSKHLLDHSKSVEGLSPQYAAPEQFDDEYGSADDITDIYQLGTVLYELFTGQPPFDGKPAKAMRKVLHEQPTPPSEIADVPEKLDEIFLTALAKEKDDRYDDILYLRDELQDLLGNL
jgi:predicted  nucleic acid-binding Zn-ribbon protein